MLVNKIHVCNDMSLIIDAARLTLLDPCPSEEAMVGILIKFLAKEILAAIQMNINHTIWII